MSSVNYEALSRFIEGLRNDLDNHVKTENSYSDAKNGRLYSENGIVCFSSVQGTQQVYSDPSIKKVLGYWPFDDELVLIAKYAKGDGSAPVSEESYPSIFSCVDSSGEAIEYSQYYKEIVRSNSKACVISPTQVYENNIEFDDAFISLTENKEGEIVGKVLWQGSLNLNPQSKICTYGILENNFYKRIYFTDYLNPFRVINLSDPNLQGRREKEFSTFQSSPLLNPIIEHIHDGGQIKAGSVLYAYRLITENGNVTEFSPFSQAVKIIKDDASGTDFKGGDISDTTSKRVVVKCNIPQWEGYKEVECYAIEYEAYGAPTAIRNLGIKSTAAYVLFNHYGNEPEHDHGVTLSELLNRQNTWKYCSDISAKKNKLIVSGLRNDPMSNGVMNLQKDFALHGWDINGNTHNCLMNPEPWKYRYFDPTNNKDMYFVKEKKYEYIKTFGDVTVSIINTENGASFSKLIVSGDPMSYINITKGVYEWLGEIQQSVDFQSALPNLQISRRNDNIFFEPLDQGVETDMSKYVLEYSHTQILEQLDEKIEFRSLNVNPNKLIFGAQSLGFNRGNGIRISYQSEFVPVLQKATGVYDGSGTLLNLEIPSLTKSFFKGEIYRLGFQMYDRQGYQLFTIPIGDIKIPEIGESRRYTDQNGNAIIETQYYANSKVIGSTLYAEKIVLKVEVRISCELQKLISMYQLTYVERTYNNRTILCQGLSAPLERVNLFFHKEHITLPDAVANKWNLPFYGGPTYDRDGLLNYDANPNKNDERSAEYRVTTSRDLFYFDSPDIIAGRVPADVVRNGSVQPIGRLNPDNNKLSWRKIDAKETFPAFSRKIKEEYLSATDEGRNSYFVNMSVFMEKLGLKSPIKIEKAQELRYGQIVPGSALSMVHEISNNAMTLAKQSWFYSTRARGSSSCQLENGAEYELFNSSNVSPGYPTVIIKSKTPLFTNDFIDETATYIDGKDEMKSTSYSDGHYFSTHALVNITMNNLESVYGGRSEVSYSKNVYVPLSQTIPVRGENDNIQQFTVYGDSYTTLFVRHKNGYNTQPIQWRDAMNNYPNCSRNEFEEKDYTRNGAWNYAFVVECSLEPKLNHNDVFYRQNKIDFQQQFSEMINEAYFQENTLRSFIPKPYRFQDDPDMNNIVAASEVKMSGDYIDKWSVFKANNFYELEKDKGAVYNLAKFLDEVYAIQKHQTSLLSVDEDVMMNTSDGQVSIQQGTGAAITGHKVISDYGTGIRRAIVEKSQNTKDKGGFAFIDENKFEWLNINQPLFFERNLHLKFKELFKNDPIVDTEGYFDDKYKETNIRIRTESGNNFVLSFNDALTVFNGFIEYDNDLYMVWRTNIYAPKKDEASSIHQLNEGDFLVFFDQEKKLKLKYTINTNPNTIKIFKAWAGILNISYHFERMVIRTNRGQERTILGDHYRYQIKEGRHSVPLKNRDDWEDLRGEWATVEVTISALNNKKIDLFSFINFVRHSFQ